MLELAHPLWLILLPLPLLLRWLPPYTEPRTAIRVPFFQTLVALTAKAKKSQSAASDRSRLQQLLIAISWCCLVLAASKPQWLGEPITQVKSGRDLLVAVDLSDSMDTRDFVDASGQRINRLAAVKQVLTELVAQRQGDRLGLIVFGSAPYLQAPFTEDHNTWLSLLEQTRTGMAGSSTFFGDAIGLSIRLFEDSGTRQRVLIVLTDGNDTGSLVPPVEAAKIAANDHITIYPIAIGDPASTDEQALDITTLQRVAELTGGHFFQALNRPELLQAYTKISQLEPTRYQSVHIQPAHSLHYVPIALALILHLLHHGIQVLWHRRSAI